MDTSSHCISHTHKTKTINIYISSPTFHSDNPHPHVHSDNLLLLKQTWRKDKRKKKRYVGERKRKKSKIKWCIMAIGHNRHLSKVDTLGSHPSCFCWKWTSWMWTLFLGPCAVNHLSKVDTCLSWSYLFHSVEFGHGYAHWFNYYVTYAAWIKESVENNTDWYTKEISQK